MARRRLPKTTRPRPLALGYVRVSTVEQAEEGASLDAQRGALRVEAERRGWDLEIVADEGFSAATVAKRPGLISALDRLDRGEADALLCVRLDRLSRSVADFVSVIAARQERHGWELVLLDLNVDTTTPVGRLTLHILAAIAEFERRMIGLRTREGMAVRRAQGVHLGAKRELPMAVVRRIVRADEAGQGLTAIARALIADKVPTARGGTWCAATVGNVLKSTTGQRLRKPIEPAA